MFVCFPSWFIFVVLLSGRLRFPSNCPVVTQLKTSFVLPKANFRQVGLKTKKTKRLTNNNTGLGDKHDQRPKSSLNRDVHVWSEEQRGEGTGRSVRMKEVWEEKISENFEDKKQNLVLDTWRNREPMKVDDTGRNLLQSSTIWRIFWESGENGTTIIQTQGERMNQDRVLCWRRKGQSLEIESAALQILMKVVKKRALPEMTPRLLTQVRTQQPVPQRGAYFFNVWLV